MIDSIIKGFEIWTDAQGVKSKGRVNSIDNISLEGISRLRGIILELATQGKLTSQNLDTENAETDINALIKAKNSLIEKGVIKKEKPLDEITEKGILFEIPNNWSWIKLGIIGVTNIGLTYSPTDVSNNGLIVLRSSNIQKGEIDLTDLVRVNKGVDDKVLVENGDLLICARNGSRQLVGKCALIKSIKEPMAFGAFMAIYRCHFNEYIKLFIESPTYRRSLDGVSTTTINQITQDNLRNTIIPIPPFEEQKRIVAKVNELMSLCDKLEEEKTKNITTHHNLVKCLLETLTKAKDADELQSLWEKISQHFDTLFYTEDSIEQLKMVILQLAAMGKLTDQETDEGFGSEVLKQVYSEKEKLADKGLIKKPCKPSEIPDEKKPFNIPKNWVWTLLSDTGIGSTGKTPSTSVAKYFGGDIPFIGPGQITENGTITESDKSLTEEGSEYSTIANAGDIIMVCIGGSIGKSAIVNSKIAFNQQLNCISPLIFDSQYLYNIFIAPFFQEQIIKKATGSATPIINRGKWEGIIIPVPPIAEQLRIVSRINELFGLCDSLKGRLKQCQVIQETLSRTILE